jgi:hypothetical protein
MAAIRKDKKAENAILSSKISRSGVAAILGVTHSYVTRLIHNGTLPQPDANGQMVLIDTVRSYIDAVRPRKGTGENRKRLLDVNYDNELDDDEGSGESDQLDVDYKHELLRENWRSKKRANDEAEGLLVAANEVGLAVDKVVSELLPVVEHLHFIALRAWPDLPPAALEAIQREVARAISRVIDSIGAGA